MADPLPSLCIDGDVILENARVLLQWISPNSPLRRNLVKRLSEGMSTCHAAKVLGVSHTMVWWARHDGEDWLVMITAHPNLHRTRVDQEDMDFFHEILDEIALHASGRSYREQTISNHKLYAIYLECCQERGWRPLSLSFISTRDTKTSRWPAIY